MVQLISRNPQKGTAQIVVKVEGLSTTLHLRQKRGTPGVFKTADIRDEAGEIVVRGAEFDLSFLQPKIDTPSAPSNPTKGQGKGGVKKSREERAAEKNAARKGGKKGKGD